MSSQLRQQINEVAQALGASERVVVLTGAGASTEAGLPDWRGPQGMWKQWSPTRLASLSAMQEHPIEFYQFYKHRLSKLRGVAPGPTQRALAALEQAGKVHCVITQNIDSLHQAAGSRDVVEVHGNLEHAACIRCGEHYPPESLEVDVESLDDLPRCHECEGLLKPGIVLFEESLPQEALQRAFNEAEMADLFLVIGSSLEVGPVNMLPVQAVHAGARLAILNMAPTHLDSMATWLIRDKAGPVLSEIARQLGIRVEPESESVSS